VKYRPLPAQQLIDVIDGKQAASRVPIFIHMWVHPDTFGDREQAVIEMLKRYPSDVNESYIRLPYNHDAPEDDPSYRWVNYGKPEGSQVTGLDEDIVIPDWSLLDGILADWPDPNYPRMFAWANPADDRYRLGQFWFCFFERHWMLRGMTNALMDYYTDPESVHRLFGALTDFYMVAIERAARELGANGVMTSDDIGTQTAPFFSVDIFREFFKPYYKKLIDKAHSLGMHFWLHACGNIEHFLPDFVEMGLDVIHPIQKHTMDERRIAATYGKDICIWAGFDVQQVIPWGTPDEVRAEVRYMMDTYQRAEGKLIFTAGNGINGDCALESLEALFEEALEYGSTIKRG